MLSALRRLFARPSLPRDAAGELTPAILGRKIEELMAQESVTFKNRHQSADIFLTRHDTNDITILSPGTSADLPHGVPFTIDYKAPRGEPIKPATKHKRANGKRKAR